MQHFQVCPHFLFPLLPGCTWVYSEPRSLGQRPAPALSSFSTGILLATVSDSKLYRSRTTAAYASAYACIHAAVESVASLLSTLLLGDSAGWHMPCMLAMPHAASLLGLASKHGLQCMYAVQLLETTMIFLFPILVVILLSFVLFHCSFNTVLLVFPSHGVMALEYVDQA